MTETLEQLRARPHWSASSIRTFLDICSLQWAFRYIAKLPPESTASSLLVGKAFHSALTWYYTRRIAGDSPTPGQCCGLYSQLLREALDAASVPVLWRTDESPESADTSGRAMLRVLLASTDPSETPVAVAEPFSLILRDSRGIPLAKPLIGEFDLVVRASDGTETVVDWKTATRRWAPSKAQSDLQAVCYLAAKRQATGREPGFRFDIVTRTKTPRVQKLPVTGKADDAVRLAAIVRRIESMVGSGHFIPSDRSFACGDCPYRRACSRWHIDGLMPGDRTQPQTG